MLLAAQVVFWVSLAAVAGVYFGYPLGLLLLRRSGRPHVIGNVTPSVTLIISAFNEAGVLREKLENSLALDYPRERLEIVVISDGSDDGTDEIAASYRDRGVVLYRQSPRGGKSAGLSQFVPKAKGEILVFSDANSMYQPEAICKLVRHFADPQVGFVVGHQRYLDEDSAASRSESLYWRYETWLKVQESKLRSPVCGDGAILAIRAGLFEPLREDDLNDMILPLRIVVRGWRGVFDGEAVCYERAAGDFRGEFRRRARIVNRALGAVLRTPQALNPLRVGVFAFQLAVHKVLRWLVPFFLLAMLISAAWLAAEGSRVYLACLLLQMCFYGAALLAIVPWLGRWKPLYVAWYFCTSNAAAALGVVRLVLGQRIVTWSPERSRQEARLQPSDSD